MLMIPEEDRYRIVAILDTVRAMVFGLPSMGDDVRAVNTMGAGISEAITLLTHLEPADEHLQGIVDTIFASGKCPLEGEDLW